MQILVMGTGGLGGYFGGLLQRAGEQVAFVARGAHLRALQTDGLCVSSPGDITLGEMDGRITPRLKSIDIALRRAGVTTTVAEDITRALWEKFVFISAMAGMTAATRAPMGEIFEHAEPRDMFRRLMEEAVAVGRARGVALDGVVDRHMAFVRDRVGADEYDMRASLYHDLAAGRRIELDALSGAVVRLGYLAGVPTALSFAVVAALRPYERRAARLWYNGGISGQGGVRGQPEAP